MDKYIYQSIEISKKIQEQNDNLKSAIFFLKNITYFGVVSHTKSNGDTIGISLELKSEISNLIDTLDKCTISGHDCSQIIENYLNYMS